MERLLLIAIAALALTSCLIQIGCENDLNLKYYNEAMLYQMPDTGKLEVETGAASIELEGWDENIIEIVVGYREYEPDDAEIYIENGAIKARSRSGKAVDITKVKGKIPKSLRLDLSNGSGNVTVSKLDKTPQIDVYTGSGNAYLADCQVANTNIEIGSGNASLTNSTITILELEAGSGNVTLTGSKVDDIDIEVGSGNVTLKDCELGNGSVTTGSGDIILQHTTAVNVSYHTGSGEVIYLE